MSLPPYTFVPGHWPHPVRDPRGHSYGRAELSCQPLDPNGEAWRSHATWCRALELFDHGYYWEAHEALEAVWIAAGREGPVADLAQGLIKLAAAAIKLRQHKDASATKLIAGATQLFAGVPAPTLVGLWIAPLRVRAEAALGRDTSGLSAERPVELVFGPLERDETGVEIEIET